MNILKAGRHSSIKGKLSTHRYLQPSKAQADGWECVKVAELSFPKMGRILLACNKLLEVLGPMRQHSRWTTGIDLLPNQLARSL
jgi:hypothetical protein